MVKKVIAKEPKPKRVDTNLKPKKAPTKSELKLQVKNLQQANDVLEASNRKKNELLKSFEGKINNLEEKIEYLSCKETFICKETQTDSNLNLKCEECNFESGNERELGWHMEKHHGWLSDQKTDDMDIRSPLVDDERQRLEPVEYVTIPQNDSLIDCNFCGEKFETKRILMEHTKILYTKKVALC